jgi:hypothetical protein
MEIKIDLSKARPIEEPTPTAIVPQKDGDGPLPRLKGSFLGKIPLEFFHIACDCHPDVTLDKLNELNDIANAKLGPTEPVTQIVNGKKEPTPAYIQAQKEFDEALDAAQQEAAANKKPSPQIAANQERHRWE